MGKEETRTNNLNALRGRWSLLFIKPRGFSFGGSRDNFVSERLHEPTMYLFPRWAHHGRLVYRSHALPSHVRGGWRKGFLSLAFATSAMKAAIVLVEVPAVLEDILLFPADVQ